MLFDLELAEEVDKGTSETCRRTGTVEFMAIEMVLGTSHTFRHELESFFYVLVKVCI